MRYDVTSKLLTFPLNDQIVFLRADLNVSIDLLDSETQRLKAIQPTLDALLSKHARVVLATHIARPKEYEEKYSTKHLLNWFKQQGYAVGFAKDPDTAYTMLKSRKHQLVLLENLRFWPEERNGSQEFARKLKGQADFYINDAFATLHRKDTSITLLPELFNHDHKTIGFLIEKELEHLQPLLDNPKNPYLIFLGGGKVSDKLPLIEGLLDYATTIVLCPALVFTFLKAQKKETGTSLIAQNLIDKARNIFSKSIEKKVELVFPIDYLVAEKTFDGPLSTVDANNFEPNHFGVSIGPKTVELLKPTIKNAKTIFFNAAMGTLKRPRTVIELESLLKEIARCHGYSVIGGGDSVEAARFFHIKEEISFCSTGGGATLTFISGHKLPGLEALQN